MGVEPEALDPIKMASAPAATVSEHIIQPLIYMDVDGTMVPNLAVSWTVSEDGLVWTLNLREGVTFHDGTPFTAEAVKLNLDRFIAKAPFKFLLARVTEVEVVDELTVKIHLSEPFVPILRHLTHSFVAMVSPAQLAEVGEDGVIELPIGTGPFKIAEWVRGEYIKLVANEDYWGGRPYLDEVVFRFIPEDAARVAALEAGDVHAIMRVPPLDVPRLEAHPEIDVVKVPSVRVIYIGFNCRLSPFDNVLVRQALNYAVDKEAIVQHVLGGAGRPSDAPITPAIFGYHKVGPYEYNPDKARELLAQAGYPDGFKTILYHPTGRYMMDVAVAEAVQAYLRDVGVEAELRTMEWAAYLSFLRKPAEEAEHPMYLLGWGTVPLDADYGLYSLFHSSQWPMAGWALSYYQNPVVDAALEQARVTPDAERRLELYRTAIEAIWHDAPWLFLHDEVQLNGVRAGVHGLIHHPLENIFTWKAWLEE
jgi:peptide/nickel transport system substrate-binding protein